MDSLTRLKKDYNERLQKYNYACNYIESCSDEEYEKCAWLYRLRLGELSVLGNAIEEYTGKKMTEDEKVNGFNI